MVYYHLTFFFKRFMNKPIIGITLDEEDKQTYSKYPWYAIRKNYSESIENAGGTSIFLPNNVRDINNYLKIIDGLLVTGGDFDIDPKFYGEKKSSTNVKIKKNRTEFEFIITKKALKKKMPVLGICGGQQLINVVLGGTLIQHIPDVIDSKINHEQENPRNEASHLVHIKKETILHNFVKCSKMFVNSAHHQAVDKLGKGLVASAISEDGIIEAIESKTHDFCLGVQWHPEFLIDTNDIKILRSLITSAKKRIEK